MKVHLLLPLTLTALALSSCSSRLLELTVAGSKNVKLDESPSYSAAHNTPTEGTHRSHIFLIFPFGQPSIDHALDDALESAGPNAVALYNMSLDQTTWYIPFLYGQKIYTVKGDPVFRTTAIHEGTPAPAEGSAPATPAAAPATAPEE